LVTKIREKDQILEISKKKFNSLLVGFDQLDREQIYQSVKNHPFRIENSVSSHIDSNFKLSLHQYLWWNILSKKLDFYSLLVHQWGFEANGLSIRVPRLRKSIADFDKPWNTASVTKKRNFNFRPIIECGQTDEQFPFCVLNLSGLRIEKNYLRVEKNRYLHSCVVCSCMTTTKITIVQ